MSRESAIAQAAAVPHSVERDVVEVGVRNFFSSYPAADVAAVGRRLDLFADDAVLEDPVGAAPTVGKEALRQFFTYPMTVGIIIHMRSDRIIVSGDEAISLTSASWGKAGEEPAKVQVVHNFAFAPDGRITRVRIFFDAGCVS